MKYSDCLIFRLKTISYIKRKENVSLQRKTNVILKYVMFFLREKHVIS